MEEGIWHMLTSDLQVLWRVYFFDSMTRYLEWKARVKSNLKSTFIDGHEWKSDKVKVSSRFVL